MSSSDPTLAPEVKPRGDRLLPVERMVGALAMAALCLISFANVVARYTTDFSFAFTEEYSIFLMVLMTFVGASVAVATGGHMRIGFIADAGTGWRRLCTFLARVCAMVMFGLIAWYGARLTWDQYRFEELSAGLGYPSWIYTIWMPALSLLIMARILVNWIRQARTIP
jgi:TRAP-type C4-dicarboxylate transport system permease small subunit